MEDKVTVWYLIPTLEVGGAEKTLVDLANNLDRDRFDVTVWTIVDSGTLREDLDEEISYRSLRASGKLDIRAVLKFWLAVRDENPDIIQSFTFFDNVLARTVKAVNSRTSIITGVRTVVEDESFSRALVDRLTIRLSDRIVSNSEAGAEHIIDRGAPAESVEVIWNGRDIEFYGDGEATQDLFDALSLNQRFPIVGTVGRLVERKGHYDLLEAWPQVLASHPSAQLLIVGDGPEHEALRQRSTELGCSDSVVLPGRRKDIPDILDAVDVFIYPSHYEGLPGALLEAMAAGLPIVTTPVDGCAELVHDGEHGLHVPPKDPTKLAGAISRYLSNDELSKRMGKAAETRASESFAVESMVSQFQELYSNLCVGA